MKTKVIHAVTVPDSLSFMEGQLKFLADRGYEMKALSSSGEEGDAFAEREGVEVLTLEMEREIALWADFKSLRACIRLLRREKPDIVNASTPKAGLIVSLAAFWTGVPIRIYTMRGLRLETASGIKKAILLTAEKIAAKSATHCLAVSESLKERVIEFGITDRKKISILGKGSGDGFNTDRFLKTRERKERAWQKRLEYGVGEDAFVLGFVGRMTKDKGIDEMVETFLKLRERHPKLHLLIVGDYDSADDLKEETKREIRKNPNIIQTGYVDDPVPFFHMMDLFVFLTKREGFGNVSIEAALSEIPVIAANVTGARDTIVDGKTGFWVDPMNPADTLEKMELLILSPELREQFGRNGRQWAIDNFSNAQIWEEMDRFYGSCLAAEMVAANRTTVKKLT